MARARHSPRLDQVCRVLAFALEKSNGGREMRIAFTQFAALPEGIQQAHVRAPVMRQQAQPSGQAIDGLIGLRQEVIDHALEQRNLEAAPATPFRQQPLAVDRCTVNF
jgi:hypothetical protein